METVSGVNNWKLTVRRETEGVTILRAATCDVRAALPEVVLGLPVTALGDRALAPTAPPVEGERVTVTCGTAGGDWDNRALRELTLPPSLRRVGDHALLNCAALERLCLHDGVCSWGGGVVMNCRRLDTFQITRVGEGQGEALAYFADQLSRELDVTIRQMDGAVVRLVFPEYQEIYEENCPAHHFDYNIRGGGYPYHHCFRRRQLRLADYDGLWREFLAGEHEELCALRLAWWRLRYPLELAEPAERAYREYLKAHGAQALDWLLTQRDTAGLGFLLACAPPDRAALTAACETARAAGAADMLAVLLETLHRQFPPAGAREFTL